MDNFLDTCIIISKFDIKDKFYEKCNNFLDNNNNFILSIYQDKIELPFLFYRKEKVISEAIKFSIMPSQGVDYKDLTPKEVIILKRLIADIKLYNIIQSELFKRRKAIVFFKQQILSYIQKNISRKVIPLEKIDKILVKNIFDKIKNEADSNIISSAIQEHQDNKLLIITNDSKDWKKETIIQVTQNTNYKEIPEIKYLT